MCGISGYIKRSGSAGPEDIKAMNDLIKHRGPNGEGYFYAGPLAFGHRRLSVIDLSEAGHQPMTYLDRYTITYNGEVYNYVELREELEALGYVFQSHTDTEVILAAYSAWGAACVERFNGMWAFAIYDAVEQIVFCSRDRFGVKPFYYAEVGDYFAFGSEIKQFTVLPGWQAKMNASIAFDFIVQGRINHSVDTFFEGVKQLRGGQNLTYFLRNHNVKICRWYNLSRSAKKQTVDFMQAKKIFLALFESSIHLRLRADVKIGSCLSGGLDSSAIVCMLNKMMRLAGHESMQETVSSCFEIQEFDEQEYIDVVVEQTQVKSHKIFPRFEDLFTELDGIIWHQDQPFGSTSIFAQWNVYRCAADHGLTVMLDGQGADEYLTGYHAFYDAYFMGLLKSFRYISFVKEFIAYRKMHSYSFLQIFTILAKLIPSKRIKRFLRQRIHKGIPKWWKVKNITSEALTKFVDNPVSGMRDFSEEQILYTSLPALLHYQDRDSMAFSIESREPFLDYRLVEFVLGLPDDYKIHLAKTKFLLREAMQGIMPQKIIMRYDKMGFVTPESVWFKENVMDFKKELCEAATLLSEYIDVSRLMTAFDHSLSKLSIGSIYWRMICLGRWIRVFKVELS
jgi:asparagine synthase (glutamine-hydrolysing)